MFMLALTKSQVIEGGCIFHLEMLHSFAFRRLADFEELKK